MRSEKQYENFLLHIEWRHIKPGGNSGVFVWSEGTVPEGARLPKGMEVQMLELEWVNLNRKSNGEPQDIGYISGELFGAGGLTATPDNPRGSRSKSLELRCKGAGEWNVYDVVCVDGTVKLSINGKFVNSIGTLPCVKAISAWNLKVLKSTSVISASSNCLQGLPHQSRRPKSSNDA